ncbi:Eukaryotic translation initiation factor 3 subunit C [Choanephora cucurbitarum]|uniref:Eukaryotic translation initiation factor 3 subunit C n=1 Tax=Choanephora cucurbitarum TaxID=101091 RepID=A0A1C7NKB2_9FUNG|nr:Eukaryotic translation initiation factor 3 subunit C [Choanephora cucurbitarum]
MSRFFRSTSDSESESDSELSQITSEDDFSDQSTDNEEQQEEEAPKRSRFLRGEADSDDSDEEGGRRQVKSQKDKRMEGLQAIVRSIENGQKNNDWGLIASEFDKLNLLVLRMTTGFDAIPIPKMFIQVIADVDHALQENTSAAKEKGKKKKASSVNIKAMSNLKQKIKKSIKQYNDLVVEYRKDPEQFMLEDDDEEPIQPQTSSKVPLVDEGDSSFKQVGKAGKIVADITPENLLVRLREILDNRGRKNTNQEEQVEILEALLQQAKSTFQKIAVLQVLLSSRFDVTVARNESLKVDAWKAAEGEFNLLLSILETTSSFIIREDAEELDHEDKDVKPTAGQVIQLRGSIVSFAERLDDDYIKSLQNTDPHSVDYIDRLRDETGLYATLVRTQLYYQKIGLEDGISRMIVRRLEHLYYKPEQVIRTTEVAAVKALSKLDVSSVIRAQELDQVISQLCSYLYKSDSVVLRSRAILFHIFHKALHNQFHQARDMLLMSHLQDTIHQADLTTQILYNRAIVQIGICAFRQGMIKESHACLQDIQGTGRAKELLAQGTQQTRQPSSAAELDHLEQHQLPFHMHINLELLECVFLVSSMLLEIPSQAQAGSLNNKKYISRPFRRLLDYNERQAFMGPPENTRDHIMSAAKALASGEWEKAKDYILSIKIWRLMPDHEKITSILVDKIQEEGLRTYLFTYASYYTTIGLSELGSMFGLSKERVLAIVSKMIFSEELSASLYQVSHCVVLHQIELTRLQEVAYRFSEKVVYFVDQNERLLTVGRTDSK